MTAFIILLVIAFIAGLLISSHKKAAEEEIKKENNAQHYRDLGFPVMETRTDEVDDMECDVANFAVKGLLYRSPEDKSRWTDYCSRWRIPFRLRS